MMTQATLPSPSSHALNPCSSLILTCAGKLQMTVRLLHHYHNLLTGL